MKLVPFLGKTIKRKGLVAGAVVLSFVLGSLLATAGSSPTSIQPTTSLASEPAPAANEKPAPPAPAAEDSPQGAVAGPKGTGRANGQDYYGVDVDEGCQPETALACGTIECKA